MPHPELAAVAALLAEFLSHAAALVHDCNGGVDCLETSGFNALVSITASTAAGAAAAVASGAADAFTLPGSGPGFSSTGTAAETGPLATVAEPPADAPLDPNAVYNDLFGTGRTTEEPEPQPAPPADPDDPGLPLPRRFDRGLGETPDDPGLPPPPRRNP